MTDFILDHDWGEFSVEKIKEAYIFKRDDFDVTYYSPIKGYYGKPLDINNKDEVALVIDSIKRGIDNGYHQHLRAKKRNELKEFADETSENPPYPGIMVKYYSGNYLRVIFSYEEYGMLNWAVTVVAKKDCFHTLPEPGRPDLEDETFKGLMAKVMEEKIEQHTHHIDLIRTALLSDY